MSQTERDRELEELLAEPILIRVADVEAERISWLWDGRLPRGKLVVVDGDPGLGKSTVFGADIVARITTGSPFPDGASSGEPSNVVILSAEDDIADTIRPRLEAAGADLKRVLIFEAVQVDSDTTRPPSIPGDLHRLEAIIRAEGARYVFVDPFSAFLSSRVDSYKDSEIRAALMPLAKLAARTGACIVVLRHLSKSGGANPLYRGGGSIGIIGAARVGLLVGVDPDDENRRVIAVTKCNIAKLAESLAFRLISDDEHGCARVVWEGTTAHRAADLLGLPGQQDERAEALDATSVLESVLTGGPRWVKECLAEMADAGFSKDQAKRAKTKLGVRSIKVGGPGDPESGWQWELVRREREPSQACEEVGTQNPTPFASLEPESLPSEDEW